MTRLVDDRAQMTLSEVGRTTDAVVDPERAAVREHNVLGETGAPGPPTVFRDGAGPHEGPQEGARADEGAEGPSPRAGP
ncbi:hypothetical protein [Streptomyces sp. DG1A-41]|uniref:hypothetical protein n=1 Tax=Streptomyces sp. DG1A-41 TaxID=3125779 RepID=UPI0030CFDB17